LRREGLIVSAAVYNVGDSREGLRKFGGVPGGWKSSKRCGKFDDNEQRSLKFSWKSLAGSN
jgi:hypothetical protein